MIWLAIPLTAWACAAAYGIWAWRDDRRAERAETRATQERTEKSFDRMQALIKSWANVREQTAQPVTTDPFWCEPRAPFPASGDNFTTLSDENVARPAFGKRPRTDTPDGVA